MTTSTHGFEEPLSAVLRRRLADLGGHRADYLRLLLIGYFEGLDAERDRVGGG